MHHNFASMKGPRDAAQFGKPVKYHQAIKGDPGNSGLNLWKLHNVVLWHVGHTTWLNIQLEHNAFLTVVNYIVIENTALCRREQYCSVAECSIVV